MVTITNPYNGASFAFEGAYKISGDFRAADGKVTSLNGSILKNDAYVGNVNVNGSGDNQNIVVSVPRTDLRSATNDVYDLLDEIEAQLNGE